MKQYIIKIGEYILHKSTDVDALTYFLTSFLEEDDIKQAYDLFKKDTSRENLYSFLLQTDGGLKYTLMIEDV